MAMIFTLGYGGWTPPTLKGVVEERRAALIDIRYRRASALAQWREPALRALLGDRYWPLAALGNVNYKGGEMLIADLDGGIRAVQRVLASGTNAILMCGCPGPAEQCHRSVVASACAEELGMLVEHLYPPKGQGRGYICLTLTQPWATLVAIGVKCIETRSWQKAYRGPLLIHARSKGTRSHRRPGRPRSYLPPGAVSLSTPCRRHSLDGAVATRGVCRPSATGQHRGDHPVQPP